MQNIQQGLGEKRNVSVVITCFVPDEYKAGGSYREYSGLVKRVDAYRRRILLQDGMALSIDYISDIQIEEGISMTFVQLKYILTIAETKSLNKAAEQLYVSQPSLTNALKELEKEVGITIFFRTGEV